MPGGGGLFKRFFQIGVCVRDSEGGDSQMSDWWTPVALQPCSPDRLARADKNRYKPQA